MYKNVHRMLFLSGEVHWLFAAWPSRVASAAFPTLDLASILVCLRLQLARLRLARPLVCLQLARLQLARLQCVRPSLAALALCASLSVF